MFFKMITFNCCSIVLQYQHVILMIVVCVSHYYGSECNTPCGQCRGDDVCDSVTGYCPHGCKPHWTGVRCDGKNCVTV